MILTRTLKKKGGKGEELIRHKNGFSSQILMNKTNRFGFRAKIALSSVRKLEQEGRKIVVRNEKEESMGKMLEATQFPLMAGVLLESIYRSPPPLVVSCLGNRTRSFSLSYRMSHSFPVHT